MNGAVLRLVLLIAICSIGAANASDRFASGGKPKIVGGAEASIRDWPWQAALRLNDATANSSKYFCGGSVIARDWVMTAAHCLAALQESGRLIKPFRDGAGRWHDGTLQVLLGSDNLDESGADNVFDVDAIFVHENYMRAFHDAVVQKVAVPLDQASITAGDDIALIKLRRPWGGPVAPLSLDAATDPGSASLDARVAGFGNVEAEADERKGRQFVRSDGAEYYAASPRLRDVKIPTVSTDVCKQNYQAVSDIYGNKPYAGAAIGTGQICAGTDGHDSCQGDSGGPLAVYDANNEKYQVGIVSWGRDCAKAGFYGVYTRISSEAGWLRKRLPELKGISRASAAVDALNTQNKVPAKSAFVDTAVAQLADELKPAKDRVKVTIPGGSKVTLNQQYRLDVESSIAGRLILIDVDANQNVTQIFPNEYTATDQLARVSAGQKIVVPAEDGSWGFIAFRAVEPVGSGKLIALVVPDEFPIRTTVAKPDTPQTKGFQPVPPAGYFMNVMEQILSTLRTTIRTSQSNLDGWAWTELDYEIVRE